MSDTGIENDHGYHTQPPPKWLEKMAIVAGALTLLMLGSMAMVGAAFLLALNGYGA